MEVYLKKPHLIVLCQAFDGDSIISSDIIRFYWRKRRRRLQPKDFAVLFDAGLLEWVDIETTGQISSEGVITQKGRDIVNQLGLLTYTCSR